VQQVLRLAAVTCVPGGHRAPVPVLLDRHPPNSRQTTPSRRRFSKLVRTASSGGVP
jgi:hypothetical protein